MLSHSNVKNSLVWLGFIIAVLPVIIFRDFTPDNELRYLSIANEALSEGHLFAFYNQGIPYADKPPLYIWIVMFGKAIFGQHYMWFLSLFSVIPALIIMSVMDKWVAMQNLADDYRLTAKLMLLTSGLFVGLALTLRMDMLMCMFITLSLYTFYKMLKAKRIQRSDTWLFPIYVFLAVFSKGPVGFLVPLLSIAAFLLVTGRIRTFGRYWGWKTWGVLLGLCIVWFLCVYAEGGTEYLNNLLFNQTVNRAVDSFHHKEPFYYYFIAFWYSLAPWSLLIAGVILVAGFRRLYYTDLEQFLFMVAITTFVMLSCISSKIAVYLAPAFPFFVYLTVVILKRFKWNIWISLSLLLPVIVFIAAIGVFIALVATGTLAGYGHWLFYVAASILTLSGLIALRNLYGRKSVTATINTLAIGLLTAVFFGGWALPSINNDIGFNGVCTEARVIAEHNDLDNYYTYGIRRPQSMDVFLDKDVQIVSEEEITEGACQNGVLITLDRRIRNNEVLLDYFAGKPQTRIGNYIIIRLQD